MGDMPSLAFKFFSNFFPLAALPITCLLSLSKGGILSRWPQR
jgi:hypothetical protein